MKRLVVSIAIAVVSIASAKLLTAEETPVTTRLNNEAFALMQQGEFEEAQRQFKELLLYRPDSGLLRYQMHDVLRFQGKPEESFEWLLRAAEVGFPPAYVRLARMAVNQDEPDAIAAQEWLDKAKESKREWNPPEVEAIAEIQEKIDAALREE